VMECVGKEKGKAGPCVCLCRVFHSAYTKSVSSPQLGPVRLPLLPALFVPPPYQTYVWYLKDEKGEPLPS
jgi:hypothetical protein